MPWLKGQSNEIFDPHFFHHSNLPESLSNGLKCFWLFLLNLPGVWYCTESIIPGYLTLASHMTFLHRSYLKGQSNKIFNLFFFIIQVCLCHWVTGSNIFDFGLDFVKLFNFFVKTSHGYPTALSQSPWGIIPWGVNLPGVSYPGELITLGYHTLGS